MTTLQIEHAVTDFDTWRTAFDRFAAIRQEAGVRQHRIHRALDDDRYVVIELDFDTADEAYRFLEFLQTKVWASSESAPALIGTPKTRLLTAVAG